MEQDKSTHQRNPALTQRQTTTEPAVLAVVDRRGFLLAIVSSAAAARSFLRGARTC